MIDFIFYLFSFSIGLKSKLIVGHVIELSSFPEEKLKLSFSMSVYSAIRLKFLKYNLYDLFICYEIKKVGVVIA